jgi:hypothetical protein
MSAVRQRPKRPIESLLLMRGHCRLKGSSHGEQEGVKAIQTFERTMERCDALVGLHRRIQESRGRGRPPQEMSDMLRGALVLAVAALDAVVLDSIVEAIPKLAMRGELGAEVAKKVTQVELLRCFGQADPHQALHDLCLTKYSAITFQKVEAIEANLCDSLGCEVPWPRAAERLKAVGPVWDEKALRTVTWNEKSVKHQLNEYVKRRNRIAHDGDRAEGAKRTSPITRGYVADAVRFLREVGMAVGDVVDAT